MDVYSPLQVALDQYNQLFNKFLVFVERMQEHPDFQLPAVSWGKRDQNTVELHFLNNYVRMRFELMRHRSEMYGRVTLEKMHRDGGYKDVGRTMFLDAKDQVTMGSLGGGATSLPLADNFEAIVAQLFMPLVPQEGGLAGGKEKE